MTGAGEGEPRLALDGDELYVAAGNPTLDVTPTGAARPGGPCLYGSIQARRLGMRAHVIGAVGEDDLDLITTTLQSSDVTAELAARGVTTTFVNRELPGGRVQWALADAGHVDLARQQFSSAGVVHLAPVLSELDAERCASLVPQGCLVGLTLQGLLRQVGSDGLVSLRTGTLPLELERRLDCLVVSETEAPHCTELIGRLRSFGCVVAVTAGAHGARVYRADEGWHVRPPLVEERDATGAGDTFAAALFIGLRRGLDPANAGRQAVAASALSVTGEGISAISSSLEVARVAAGLAVETC